MRHPKALYHAIVGVVTEAERLGLSPEQVADRLMDVIHGIADVDDPAVREYTERNR